VDVIQVDIIHSQALKTGLAGSASVLGRRVDLEETLAVGLEAELRGQEDVRPPLRVQTQPLPDCLLAVPVRVRRIPVRAADLPGPVQEGEARIVGTRGRIG
jgi:hypothetical protein